MLKRRNYWNLLIFYLASVLGVAMISRDAVAQYSGYEPCTPLYRSKGLMAVAVSLYKSGHYCLLEDLVQRNLIDLIDRSNPGSPGKGGFISIMEAQDVEVDMQGHLATSSPFNNTVGINIQPDATRVIVRNGTIRTPGPFGIGAWIAGDKPYIFKSFDEEDVPPLRSKYNEPGLMPRVLRYPWDYKPPTHHLLDTLAIQSGGRGVVLAGDGNTLRNSTVEVDSAVAAYIYGPNAVIEGNTFIVHTSVDDAIPPTSAILKLRDADNAVIRNNRFIFKGPLFSQAKSAAAINLLASKNVTIENNTFERVELLVRKDDATTVVEQGNLRK